MHPQVETYRGNVNPIGPRACYDEGKRVAETMCYAYQSQSGVDVRVARIFNTFGPRMHIGDGRVVSNFIIQARHPPRRPRGMAASIPFDFNGSPARRHHKYRPSRASR